MAVPNIFGSATSAIPLSQLDQNFATAITLGNTAVYLGNTTTSLGNVTLTNVTISSGNVTVTGANVSGTANVSTLIITGNQTSLGNVAITGNISANIATFSAGSNTAPSITTSGDTNTGIFFPAADTIAFAEGGVESMRIDSSGNVGIGVTPSAWSAIKPVQVGNAALGAFSANLYATVNTFFDGSNWKYITSDFACRYQQSSGQHQWYTAASGTAGNTATFTQAMTLDASGRLGIGTTSPVGKFTAQNSDNSTVAVFCGDSGGTARGLRIATGIQAGVTSNNELAILDAQSDVGVPTMVFQTAGTERARITSGGNLLVGATSTSGNTGRIASIGNASGFDTYQGYNNGGTFTFAVSAGGTVFAVSTTISSISDIRFKENIRDLNVGLAEVMTLKPRLYDWKEGKGADIKNARGFIAQEFEEVFPDLIDEWKDPAPEGEEPYKSVRADLIPVLVKAIQEMKAIIDTQAERIAVLEAK